MRAFGVNAVDYLLKPFAKQRFWQALIKARRFLDSSGAETSDRSRGDGQARRILVKDGAKITWLTFAEIDWIEASENYVILHVGQTKRFVRSTFRGFEAQLPKDQFVRLSRSAMVNAARLLELRRTSDGKHVAILRNGQQVPLTRSVTELMVGSRTA